MTIQLSPALEKRVARAAKEKGIKPDKLVEEALNVYFAKPPVLESQARRELSALLKNKKRTVDFDTAVHKARVYARQLEQDNAEFIEAAAKRYAKPKPNP